MAIKRMKLSSGDTAKINRTDSIKRFEATLKKRTIEKFEEIELIREYQKTGDQRLKERIVDENMTFIFSAAKSFTNNTEEILDLCMEGANGLCEAIEKFSPDEGNKFISFAIHHIFKYMVASIHSSKLVSRYTDYKYGKKIMIFRDSFFAGHGRYPSDDEIIDYLSEEYGITIPDNSYLNPMEFASIDDKSMDDDMNEYSPVQRNFDAENSSYNDYLKEIEHEDIKERITECLSILTQRDREIMEMIYGINREPMFIDDIADHFNMTKTRIEQIKKESIIKMQRYLKAA